MKDYKGSFSPLSAEEEEIGRAIVNAAYIVHKELGPGLLEKFMKYVFVMFWPEKDILLKYKSTYQLYLTI